MRKQQKIISRIWFLGCGLAMAMVLGCHSDQEKVSSKPQKETSVQSQASSSKVESAESDFSDTGNRSQGNDVQQLEAMLKEEFSRLEKQSTPTKEDIVEEVLASIKKTPAAVKMAPKKATPKSQPLQLVDMPALSDPQLRQTPISLNLGQVDIVYVIQLVGESTGINFVWGEEITGSISVNSPTEIKMGELYHFLETVLELKGYAAVPSGKMVKIVKRSQANQENLQVRIGSDPDTIALTDTVITQIIPLEYADAQEVKAIINSRKSESALLDVNNRSNKIIITDTSANIHHMAKIIAQLDIPEAKPQTVVYPLKHASAQMLSRQVSQIMQKQQALGPNVRRPNGASLPTSDLKVQPDQRINALVVTANTMDLEIIEALIKKLDIEKPTGYDNVHVVSLKNASADKMAQSLSQALANLRGVVGEGVQQPTVTPDLDTNSLIVSATQQDFSVISKIITRLDVTQEMVLVEVKIMEITEKDLVEIGIDWATLEKAVEDSVRGFASSSFGPRPGFINGSNGGLSLGLFKEINGEVTIGSVLQALEENQGINFLSTPSVVTRNHQEAIFIAGENEPFVGQSKITEDADPITPTVVQTFDYRDVGVTLKVTPHISQSGTVIIDVHGKFTSIVDGRPGQSVNTPSTSIRSVDSSLVLSDGQTSYISGLMRDDLVTLDRQVPLLGDIPLLGEIFKWKRKQNQKTNLLISITPHVISGQSQMADKTNEKIEEINKVYQEVNASDDVANEPSNSIWK